MINVKINRSRYPDEEILNAEREKERERNV